MVSAGGLIADDSEDPEKKRHRILAEQNGSDIGAALGLVIGAAMALTETEPTEEQAIQDDQNFNEFLTQIEAEEDEQVTRFTM